MGANRQRTGRTRAPFLALKAHRCYVSSSMDYKDTLNLPRTSFPMKANLPKLEPDMLARWD